MSLDNRLKEIPGYENLYLARDDGEIWSITSEKYLKQWHTANGYKQVILRGKAWRPHRLIALAFIDNPENKPFVNHINGVKDDNRAENLEWCTRAENARHSIDVLKRWPNNAGSKSSAARLTDNQVSEIRKLKDEGFSYSRLSRIFNTSQSNIVAVVKGHNWSHIKDGDEYMTGPEWLARSWSEINTHCPLARTVDDANHAWRCEDVEDALKRAAGVDE